MPSFDIVSEIELNEVTNAVDNANRELATRFDFRGVTASFSHDDGITTIKCEGEFQVSQMRDILRTKLSKRGIDPESLSLEKIEITGKTATQKVKYLEGIEKDVGKKLVKLLKDGKLKVQPAIQGDKVRVTGKKRDDLQAAMKLIKDTDLGQPFQFNNFRD